MDAGLRDIGRFVAGAGLVVVGGWAGLLGIAWVLTHVSGGAVAVIVGVGLACSVAYAVRVDRAAAARNGELRDFYRRADAVSGGAGAGVDAGARGVDRYWGRPGVDVDSGGRAAADSVTWAVPR